jgi:hypothetical protein
VLFGRRWDMSELINLSTLNPNVSKIVEPYCKKMISLHGDNIICIAIYGSATGLDFVPKRSNLNLLVILKKIGLEDLDKSLKLVASGRKKRIIAPLFLTLRHIESSSDVFPIEFLELRENHVLLFGEDVISRIDINEENLRLQCEQQLKGKLIRLRQAYLESGLKPKEVKKLLADSLVNLTPVFRNMLRLKDIIPPVSKEEIIRRMGNEFGLEISVFLKVLSDKLGKVSIRSGEVREIFNKYLAEIQALSIKVDEFKVKDVKAV